MAGCRYMNETGKDPCCTHSCDGCSWYEKDFYDDRVKRAEKILIDNGIEADEAPIVLQAIGYALLDLELYPE